MSQYPLLSGPAAAGGSLLLRDLADRLFRQKRLLLTLFAVLNAGAAAYLAFTPRSYEAEIKFLVQNNRADPLVTPESTSGQVWRNYIDESVIATEIQLLSNRELLREVVRKCKLAENDSERAVEKALKDLREELKVSPVLKANMIKASYQAPDPAETAAVLQALADGYLNEHLKARSTTGAYQFFNRQAEHYQKQLRDLQARLAQFQQERKIVLLGQQKDLNLRKLVDLEGSLKDTEAARAENDRRIRTLKAQLQDLAPRITTQARRVPNQYSVERLNTMLAELQNRRTELLTKFRPEDRLIQQVDQQIADTKAAMERADRIQATEESTDVNPLRQSLEAELAKAELNATALAARASSQARQVEEYRRSLGLLQNATPDDDQLLRDIKEAEDAFFLYSKKREEARITEAMDQQKIANVALVEPPRAPQRPKPKLTGGFLAGYLFGCLLIAAAGLGRALARNTVFTPWELEALTGLPVLASLAWRPAPGPVRCLEHQAVTESLS